MGAGIKIYAVTETEGTEERVRYQYDMEHRSTYAYSDDDGDVIGVIVERSAPVLAGRFVPAPGVTVEMGENQYGDEMLFLDGKGFRALDLILGVADLREKGHFVRKEGEK